MNTEQEKPQEEKELSGKLDKLATIELLPMDQRINTIRQSYHSLNLLLKQVMKKGTDFGEIPGVKKASLFKPGAEKLRMLFGLSVKMERTDTIMDKNIIYFTYKCTLTNSAGHVVGECEGSCNSKETKYRYNTVDIPNQLDIPYIEKLKKEGLLVSKNVGQKTIFQERVEKKDYYDQINTFKKMAQKRAFIGAILIATGTSEYYTQDLEDFRNQFEDNPTT